MPPSRIISPGTLCGWCGKAVTEFKGSKKFCDRKCYVAHYHATHKEDVTAHKRKYQFSDHGKAKRKVWETENRETLKEKDRAYYMANRTEIIAKSVRYAAEKPEIVNAAKKRYDQTHRGRTKNYEKRRRRLARQAKSVGHFTKEQFLNVARSFDWKCLSCGHTHNDEYLEADHIVPISKGGSNDISNIQPLCRQCNAAKRDQTIDYRSKHRDWLLAEAA